MRMSSGSSSDPSPKFGSTRETAGSVPAASDLVVSDPVQAGVMTVMAVAETAKFSLARLKRREF